MLCSVVLVLLLLLLRAFVVYWSVCVCRIHRPFAVSLAGCFRDQVVFSLVPVCPLKKVPVCTFKTSRVSWHHTLTCFNMCAWCRAGTHGTFRTYTRGRFEWTHGVFQRVTSLTTPRTTTHDTTQHQQRTTAQHDTPHHNTPQHTTTPHGDRDRERHKEKAEREEKTKEERGEDKTRRKRREDQDIKRR